MYELVFVKVRLSFGRILLKYPLRQSIKIALSFPSLLHLVPQFDAVWYPIELHSL